MVKFLISFKNGIYRRRAQIKIRFKKQTQKRKSREGGEPIEYFSAYGKKSDVQPC